MAWQRAVVRTSNFTQFESACDDGDIKSGDADRDAAGQLESAVVGCLYLYEATGDSSVSDICRVELRSGGTHFNTWWGPYQSAVERALLRYSGMPNANTSHCAGIRNQKGSMNYAFPLNPTMRKRICTAHKWTIGRTIGAATAVRNCGTLNMDFVEFNINPDQAAQYRETAEQYVHWLHGTNPLGMVMLSNM
ncbi:MAG: glycoside hydrolase family 9 protein [Lewinellaceae bacterium]|nr:glycoside hydrolase family 9 protein [Lewinellaceae bacterium]